MGTLVKPAAEIMATVPGHLRGTPVLAGPPAPPAKPELDLLLERGAASVNAATRRLAARPAREHVAALNAEAEQDQVLAQIAQLRKQLNDAEAKLNRLRGVQPRGGRAAGLDTSKVRAWAAANGLKVAAAGMVPAKVLDAYRAAHGSGS